MRQIYRNLENPHKLLEVVRYGCGHYRARQVMQCSQGENCYRAARIRKSWLDILLQDYEAIEAEG